MSELIKSESSEESLTKSIQAGSDRALCFNYLKDHHKLRYNIITNNLEDHNITLDGKYKVIGEMQLNTMYVKFSDLFGKRNKVSKDFFNMFIFSEHTEFYNPFISFFEKYKDYPTSQELISTLAATIKTDTVHSEKYIKHWACGMIASVFGSQSPLTLVLAGEEINLGKTEWFRRLLPDELKPYYAESKLDGGKDDDILMCKKLIIMDDEFGGKNKRDHQHFKGLTSKQNITVRMPYGKSHVELRRICSLCGTSNKLELLSDPYGNRRILPINVLGMDHEKYNAIDKISLFMAFYWLYARKFHWKFTRDDIKDLNSDSSNFEETNQDAELMDAHFEVPESESEGEYMTNTQIRDYIETRSKQKIWDYTKFGIDLKKMGFTQTRKKIKGIQYRMYLVKKKVSETPSPLSTKPLPVTSEKDPRDPF